LILGFTFFLVSKKNSIDNHEPVKELSKQDLTESKAKNLVTEFIKSTDSSSYLLNEKCVLITSEEKGEYYQIEYHENHTNPDCGGNTGNNPLLSLFRVNKVSKTIEKYDVITDSYESITNSYTQPKEN
ncbi:MAG: hypothetical protein IT416_01980, partial [Candidatus Pacebacteria bacterium]|nr:hypothetical protein [Candidatus Paceibacterota bacterium]